MKGRLNHTMTVILSLFLLLSACAQENPADVNETYPPPGITSEPSNESGIVPERQESIDDPDRSQAAADDTEAGENGMIAINITIGDKLFAAGFYESESTQALIDQMPFTLEMADYAGQEKVARIPFDLPSASTKKPDAIRSGEIYLWSGDSLVLFYTTFSNSYGGYFPIGYIEDVAGLIEALGAGDAAVTFDTLPFQEDQKGE